MVPRGGKGAGVTGLGKMGGGSQNVQTSSYKINKSWEYNVQYREYTQ